MGTAHQQQAVTILGSWATGLGWMTTGEHLRRKSEISPPDRPRYRTYTPNGIAPRSREDQKPGFCDDFRIPTEIVKETRYETPTGISYGFSPSNLW